jgi:hypothetical protein
MYLFVSTEGIMPFESTIEASNWFDNATTNREDFIIIKDDKVVTQEQFYLFLYSDLVNSRNS